MIQLSSTPGDDNKATPSVSDTRKEFPPPTNSGIKLSSSPEVGYDGSGNQYSQHIIAGLGGDAEAANEKVGGGALAGYSIPVWANSRRRSPRRLSLFLT